MFGKMLDQPDMIVMVGKTGVSETCRTRSPGLLRLVTDDLRAAILRACACQRSFPSSGLSALFSRIIPKLKATSPSGPHSTTPFKRRLS
jgi:hypothetical protein